MDDDIPLFTDFQDIYVVYFVKDGVRAVYAEFYSRGIAEGVLSRLELEGHEAALGRTIRFMLTDDEI